MEALRQASHEEGLMFDMIGPMSEKIEEALDELSEDRGIPPWQR